MAIRTVKDEQELPPPMPGAMEGIYYVRSMSDPRYLIHAKTGEVFRRADGKRWEWPAWIIGIDKGVVLPGRMATAWFDEKRFPYAAAESAA